MKLGGIQSKRENPPAQKSVVSKPFTGAASGLRAHRAGSISAMPSIQATHRFPVPSLA